MQVSNTLKHISNYLVENGLEEPRQVQELQEELRNSKNLIKTMRTIVSMIQQGYDLNVLYSDVLKVIDTNNYELKILCNFYLKSTCSDKPACQLMCTQTFMKDFNEINDKIQRLAVHDAVVLCDDILIKNYVDDIKRMSSHDNPDIRAATAACISSFYLKNKKLFHDKLMAIHLKDLLNDRDMHVKIAALNAIAVIEEFEELFPVWDILKLAKKFNEKGKTSGLRAALDALKHKKLIDSSKELYLELLDSSDVCVFYLAASKLLTDDQINLPASSSLYNQIYESCLFFMRIRPEQFFNLLLFIFSFVNNVTIEISDFLVLRSDPVYIKELKIKILLKAMKNLAVEDGESIIKTIKREIKEIHEITSKMKLLDRTVLFEAFNLAKTIVYNAIYFDVFIDEAFKDFTNEMILEPILNFNPRNGISSKWRESISTFLNDLKEIHSPEIFIELVYRYSLKIPKIIFTLENEKYCKNLLKLYLGMREKGIITNQQCSNYIKNMHKKLPLNGFIKIVSRNFESIRSEQISIKLNFVKRSFESVSFTRSLQSNRDTSIIDQEYGQDQSYDLDETALDMKKPDRMNRKKQDKESEQYCHRSHNDGEDYTSNMISEQGSHSIEEKCGIKSTEERPGKEIANQSSDNIADESNSSDKAQHSNESCASADNKVCCSCSVAQSSIGYKTKKPLLNNRDSAISQQSLTAYQKPTFPIYVNTATFKGTIEIEGSSIILTVDILEKPQSMEWKIGSSVSKNVIRSEGKYTISCIPKNEKFFKIKIGKEEFAGEIII